MTQQTQKLTHFRYRLHPDSDSPSRQGVSGIVLLKPEDNQPNWLMSAQKINSLESFIRTKDNPKGIVEHEEYDAFSGETLFEAYPKNPPVKTDYTRQELASLSRQTLIATAKSFGLSTVGNKEDVLINKILSEQEKLNAPKPENPAIPVEITTGDDK